VLTEKRRPLLAGTPEQPLPGRRRPGHCQLEPAFLPGVMVAAIRRTTPPVSRARLVGRRPRRVDSTRKLDGIGGTEICVPGDARSAVPSGARKRCGRHGGAYEQSFSAGGW
jgi:hypothetical protein